MFDSSVSLLSTKFSLTCSCFFSLKGLIASPSKRRFSTPKKFPSPSPPGSVQPGRISSVSQLAFRAQGSAGCGHGWASTPRNSPLASLICYNTRHRPLIVLASFLSSISVLSLHQNAVSLPALWSLSSVLSASTLSESLSRKSLKQISDINCALALYRKKRSIL